MDYLVELPPDAVKMGFVASCVEHVARKLGVPYKVVFDALQRCDAIHQYIVPHYNALHSQSREHVNEDIIEYLHSRGELI